MIDRVRQVGRRIAGTPDGPLALSAILAALAMIQIVLTGSGDPTSVVSTGLLLGVTATLPLALVPGHVVGAALTITLANMVTLAGGLTPTATAVLAQLFVGYLLARTRPRRIAFPLVLPFLVYVIADPATLTMLLVGLLVGVVLLGDSQRERTEEAARAGSTRAMADSLLEHAARGERARIARELHDVVAHHISLIAVQAETARLTTPGMPPDGLRRLAAIGDTARSALTEMRRLLGVLREDAGAEPTRSPQPGLDQLNELIDSARDSTGASTRLIVRGRVAALDPGIELTAYRIVQEALTNARRHAPGAAVDVDLHYTGEELRIRVRDNGPGPVDAGGAATGHGLLGMRERAASVGGTVAVGPGPLGGYLVDAALPTCGGDA